MYCASESAQLLLLTLPSQASVGTLVEAKLTASFRMASMLPLWE